MTSMLLNLPTWSIIRAAGLGSYASLFLGITLGLLYTMSFTKGKAKANLYKVHSILTNFGLMLAVVHFMFLIIDTYMPFSWREIFVPFTAAKNPIFVGLGTIALYGLVLIIITTDFKLILNPKVWRFIHLTAYPVFLLAMLHGVFTGTDTKEPYVYWFYIATLIVTVSLILVKGTFGNKKRENRDLSRIERKAGNGGTSLKSPHASRR